MSGELAIRTRGVVKRYGLITAVHGLDLWRVSIYAMTRKLID